MKKVLIAFAAALCMVGCSLTTQQKQVSEAVKQQLQFPDEYKFISLDSLATVTYGEQLDKRIKHFHRHLVLNRALRFETAPDSLMEQALLSLRKQKADSLDVEAASVLKLQCRIKTDVGTTADTTFYVWVNPQGDVLKVYNDSTSIGDCPVDFVDYYRIFNEILMK